MVGFLRTAAILVVVVLVLTITVQARVDPSTRCIEPNEEYNSCGTACPVTCEDVLNSNTLKPCTLQCVPGCACQKGYVRESEEEKSRCVKEEECHFIP